MARKPKSSPPPNPAELGLEVLRTPPDELGLSLDELSQAYAALLGGGDDPYAPAPPPPDGITPTIDDADVEQELAEAQQAVDADADDPADSPPIGLAAARDEQCEISPRTILEAMLFVGDPANQPLTAKQVAGLMRGVLPREIDELVRDLNETYEADGMPYSIESEGAGYRLCLRSEFAGLRERFLGRVREVRLAPPAVDVLAIIAYNQPVDRQGIDKMRGKPSGALLGLLVRRGLVRMELPDQRGQPAQYYTTDRFLELFNLQSLNDLPRSSEVDRSLS